MNSSERNNKKVLEKGRSKNMEPSSFWTSPPFLLTASFVGLGLAVIAISVAIFSLFRSWNAMNEAHAAIQRAEAAYSTSVRTFYVGTLPYLDIEPIRYDQTGEFLNYEKLPFNEVKLRFRYRVANIGIGNAASIRLGPSLIENLPPGPVERSAPPINLPAGSSTECVISYITPVDGDVDLWVKKLLASEKVLKQSLSITYWVPYDDARYEIKLSTHYSLNDARVLDYKLSRLPK